MVQLLGLVPGSSSFPLAEQGLLCAWGVPPLIRDIAAVVQGARDSLGVERDPRVMVSRIQPWSCCCAWSCVD